MEWKEKRGKRNNINTLRKMRIVDNFFILLDLKTEKAKNCEVIII
jgi:Mn-dependent DtxR family transcriptional regulator